MTNEQFLLEHNVSPSFLKGYLKLAYQGGLSFKVYQMRISVTKIRNLRYHTYSNEDNLYN